LAMGMDIVSLEVVRASQKVVEGRIEEDED
jgi:hypothetical protein